MGNTKNQEFKNKIKQAVQNTQNPAEIYSRVQESLQSHSFNYSYPREKQANEQQPPKFPQPKQNRRYEPKPVDYSQYDIGMLMDKLGNKMPPGVKQMMEQFINVIPKSGNFDSADFKKEMKKKMKGFKSAFKSPYE
ncbi:Uncharacterized [Syntrophomonas zehnderi OL-4]|uniref:Uncharacterized n=1 Tax=Syntrophomonas zehnderi OL-4 TaxID=690567 RepID=A0A0E4GB49_9FIRM|nr:hypothetical protein [Syntrophomonas zehnderi]CFX78133.1 Uncharacterized [Syntrophomonas zehnderi OL-4]